MIIYLTYNDQPSGVYWSQVTDVVDHLNALQGDQVRLVALISLRGYLRSRRRIRQRMPRAIVLPMVPRQNNWRANWIWVWLICRLLRPSGMIARGVFATALALRMRDSGLLHQVCFDARAAYGAEWQEYRVVDDDRLITECAELERDAVHGADLRIAVSQALVRHWRERFDYAATRHLVIPCTLGRSVERSQEKQASGLRADLGWSESDTILVYSGTAVGWQSLELAERLVSPWLHGAADRRMLFLSNEHAVITRLEARFPSQVARRWVDHAQVRSLLLDCDAGLLLREDRITNQVASPTKFAEYLSAGLPVLISERVGDFSRMVQQEGLGSLVQEAEPLVVPKPSREESRRLMELANTRFTKEAYDKSYGILKACMATEPSLPNPSPFRPDAGTEPLISVVVPSYNKQGFIGDMVRSVQRQSMPRWELIVVDDRSTDETVPMLRAMAEADARITVEPLETNRGANHCRNLGIELARAPYIIFLDADDLLAPDCFERRLAVMDGSGMHFSVSTMEVFRTAPGDSGQRWVPVTRDALRDFFRHQLPWQTMQPIWDRAFLRALHGFDTAFSRHQDVELHTRALLMPGVRYRMRRTEPDCFYRIAEERKVIDPRRLLTSFAASAVLYVLKFKGEAALKGHSAQLLGIIHRTYLQLLLYAKLGRIDRATLDELEKVLLPEEIWSSLTGMKRALIRFTRWYNLLPVRVPGINLAVFRLLTSGGRTTA
ncbi:MAG: glycosyltransferase [Flavobacteriales bacterium]|nr:glycosyltransferase [Flavobacteriales bacterium]